jgi:hypothetical protein
MEAPEMKTERLLLRTLPPLLILSLACSLGSLFASTEEGGTAPGTAAPTTAGQPSQVPEGQATQGPRRLELPVTPTPFHVTSEDDPRSILDLSQPDYFDYFDNPDNWHTYESAGYAAYRMEDGHLLGVDEEPEERYIYWSYTFMQAGNTYIEVSTTNGDCVGKDSVGLVVRVDATVTPSGYAYEVSCDGSWRLRRFHGNDNPVQLVDWTPSNSINSGLGAVNRLGVWAYQGEFQLFANGYAVGEASDPNLAYTIGFIALYVRASQTFDLTATFDDLAFWNIPFQQ